MNYDRFCINVGANIKYFRNRMKMTQDDLSEKIELAARYISDIERSKRNITLNVRERLAIRNVSESFEWRTRQRSCYGSRFSEAVQRRTAFKNLFKIAQALDVEP